MESAGVLAYVTINAARAMGMVDLLGSITVGKRADLLLLSTARDGFPILDNLADRVASYGQSADIDSFWIAGKLRKSGGRMIDVDMKKLAQKNVGVQAEMERGVE